MSDDVKKAVTSESIIDNGPVNEAVASGESKPAIEDSKSLADIQKEQTAPTPTQVEKPFSLGSTLVQGENGNVFTNFKVSPIDYVEAAKPKGVVTMSAEELKKLSEQPKVQKSEEAELDFSSLDNVIEKASKDDKKQMMEKLQHKMEEAKKCGDMKTYKACKAMCSRMNKALEAAEQ